MRNDLAESSLDFALVNVRALQRELREAHDLAVQIDALASKLGKFESELERNQSIDQLRELGAQLRHAKLKLAWENEKKWRHS